MKRNSRETYTINKLTNNILEIERNIEQLLYHGTYNKEGLIKLSDSWVIPYELVDQII